MSQPAVSSAAARPKVMFDGKLFIRCGRGIQPTARALQLFGSVRQALQLIQNELPGSGFEPASSERVSHLCIYSPLDNILTSQVYSHIEQIAPSTYVMFKSSLNRNTEHQLRYQKTKFVISYEDSHCPEFTSMPLLKDEVVLMASKNHPTIRGPLLKHDVYDEQHAAVPPNRLASFSQTWYDTVDKQASIAYQDITMVNVSNVISQMYLVAITPRWLAEELVESLELQVLSLPSEQDNRTCYLSRHKVTGCDKGHQWMEEQLVSTCKR